MTCRKLIALTFGLVNMIYRCNCF